MAGLQRQLTAHIRWLRTNRNRAHWGSLQRSLIHEFQVALNGGAIFQWMLGQAMPYARGLPPTNHPRLADPYPPLNPGEARRASQRLVDEVTVHCDILGRLLQSYSGETMAHEDRVRFHLARMEDSPFQINARRVRQRMDNGLPEDNATEEMPPGLEKTPDKQKLTRRGRQQQCSLGSTQDPSLAIRCPVQKEVKKRIVHQTGEKKKRRKTRRAMQPISCRDLVNAREIPRNQHHVQQAPQLPFRGGHCIHRGGHLEQGQRQRPATRARPEGVFPSHTPVEEE